MPRDWLEALNASGVRAVAEQLDLRDCPACGAETRGRGDRRAPLGCTRDGRGWRCFRGSCGARGSAADLVAYRLTGQRFGRENCRKVRDWWEGSRPKIARSRDCFQPAPTPTACADGYVLAREERRAAGPPPPAEVRELWERCTPVTGDREIVAYLRGRAIDAAAVEDFDLARALPSSGRFPRFALCGGSWWSDSGHRLILPLWNAAGELASVRARAVRESSRPAKALAPQGWSVAGLVLADGLGRLLLSGGALADGSSAEEFTRRTGIVVGEGETDFLTRATACRDGDEEAPAVLGIVAGSWTAAVAARVPSGAPVLIETDHDTAGNIYARGIARSLGTRCPLSRGKKEAAA